MTAERVQKILAHAGYGSRRACEKFIEAGRVLVNGKRIKLGVKADPLVDDIVFDGQSIKKSVKKVYIALHKPRGVISSTVSQSDAQTVLDLVPSSGGLYPVGRLDIESEGLILLTNDGDLTNLLTHPRYEKEKEYKVLVAKKPDQKQLESWRRGVVLADGHKTGGVDVYYDRSKGKGSWLKVVMKEGHKRQIRETARVLGLPVVKLIRIRIGSLLLGNLKPREHRHLNDREVKQLKQLS
ncbi:MAG: rRNA pseudouridine synthase [Candidatus Heimdallarchaeota archaeon]|nr:rRNA pseudouridine synthase [Candidatus Heimdallarchaeota archaeon]